MIGLIWELCPFWSSRTIQKATCEISAIVELGVWLTDLACYHYKVTYAVLRVGGNSDEFPNIFECSLVSRLSPQAHEV
jgi:hypothetical protein